MTALLCTAPRKASAAASRSARWAPARHLAPTADADPPATAGTARTNAAGMCRPAPTAAGAGLEAPTAPLSGDQQNLEAEVHIHLDTPGLVADTDCLDPEVVIQVFLLVH